MGTPFYAVPTLEALNDHHEVVGVFTRKDAPSKRGKDLVPCEVKQRALELGLRCESPATLRNEAALSLISEMKPDIIIVAAYGMILPKDVLDIPRYGCVNLHASLLPRWRGAAPIQRAILADDEIVGVVLMRMEEGLDTGDFALAQSVDVGEKSTEELTKELGEKAAKIALEGIQKIAEGTLEWTEQDETLVTYADKILKSDVSLSPKLTAHECAKRVRASNHSAPARLILGDKTITVVMAQPITPDDSRISSESVFAAGSVCISKKIVALRCSDTFLELLTVKPEGKKEMSARDFGLGLKSPENLIWESVK